MRCVVQSAQGRPRSGRASPDPPSGIRELADGATCGPTVRARWRREWDYRVHLGADAAEHATIGTGKDGLIEGFRRGASWFDLSTNAVDGGAIGAVRPFAEKGVDFLDAPVGGGGGAASGRLAIWVGGDKGVFDMHHRCYKDGALYPSDGSRIDRQARARRLLGRGERGAVGGLHDGYQG